MPEGGEPEDYILAGSHSPEIADQLGWLWELVPPEDAVVESVRLGRGVWECRVEPFDMARIAPLRAKSKRHLIATEEAKNWLECRAWSHFIFRRLRPAEIREEFIATGFSCLD